MWHLSVYAPLTQLVRVALYAFAYFLVADVLSPHVGIGQEESLFGCESVDYTQRFLGSGILKGLEGYHQSAVVGHILAQRQAAVGMQSGQHLYAVVELSHHLYAFAESLGVLVAPPLAQVALLVVLGALVVESVCHLVTNHHAYGSVVEGIVGLHVEEWGLQYACGEANLVGRGVIVCIHRLGCHEPLLAVHGLVQFRAHHILYLPLVACQHVPEIAVANLQFAVILPLVGIAHFHVEGIQFLLCHLLRLVAHPILYGNAFAQCHLQVADQRLHALLGCGWEETFGVQLSQRLAQHTAHGIHSAFPSRTVLSLATHCCAVEGEVQLAALVVDVRAGHIQCVPQIHVLQGLGRFLLQHLLHLVQGSGLSHADFLHALHAEVREVCVPVYAGELFLQFLVRQFVVILLRVAQLRHALAGTCQSGLDAHHVGADAACVLLAESLMLAQSHDVLVECLANLCRFGVSVHVVILLSQRQSALDDGYQILFRVLLVGTDVHAEQTLNTLTLHAWPHVLQPVFGDFACVLVSVAQQELLQCAPVVFVQVHAVHGRVIQVGNLLCHAARFILLGSYAVDERAQLLVVVLLQHVERPVAAVFRCQRVTYLPSVCGIFIEIRSRSIGRVQIGQVYARAQGFAAPLASRRSGCRQH